MKKQTYISPKCKLLLPANRLLQTNIPVESYPNEDDILGKRHFGGVEDDDSHTWGRVWGSDD